MPEGTVWVQLFLRRGGRADLCKIINLIIFIVPTEFGRW